MARCQNFLSGVVDIAKHLLDHTFLRKQMMDFVFVCFHQGVFSFYLGMLSVSTLPNRSRAITQCLSAS